MNWFPCRAVNLLPERRAYPRRVTIIRLSEPLDEPRPSHDSPGLIPKLGLGTKAEHVARFVRSVSWQRDLSLFCSIRNDSHELEPLHPASCIQAYPSTHDPEQAQLPPPRRIPGN